MRILIVITLIILANLNTFSYVYAQTPSRIDNDRVFNPSRFARSYITLSSKKDSLLFLNSFKDVTVIDARPDSFAFGFRKRDVEVRKKLLQFEKGLKNQLTNFIRDQSKLSADSNGYCLIVVVRDFWIREFDTDEDDKDKVLSNSGAEMNFRESCLKIEFDCFINKNENYYAAFRIDTAINKFLNIPEFTNGYLEYFIRLVLHKAASLHADSIAAVKRKFSVAEVNNYYLKRFELPILREDSVRRGIYANFEEFKTNKPSIADFEIQKGKLADVLFAFGKPTRENWGYCDGKMAFIKAGENYYPLVRVQNSFYFLGSIELNRSKRGPEYDNRYYNNNARNNQTTFRNILLPMKLNWQTGKPY